MTAGPIKLYAPSRHIAEIASERGLVLFGAALALTNALTVIYWSDANRLVQVLDPAEGGICWPFFTSCRGLRGLGPTGIRLILSSVFLLAVASAVSFLMGAVQAGYWSLVAVTAAVAGIVLQDYRLVLNQHYMVWWVTMAFLGVTKKRPTIELLLVLFYVFAGLLKLTPEWIAGDGLYGRRPFGMPAYLIPIACTYVIPLELVMSWCLLAGRRWLFWAGFAQIAAFHFGSFWVVGFYYPILMYLLLSIFVIDRLGWSGSKRPE